MVNRGSTLFDFDWQTRVNWLSAKSRGFNIISFCTLIRYQPIFLAAALVQSGYSTWKFISLSFSSLVHLEK